MSLLQSSNTICVIPARYASTRLPGKPLVKIADKPLVMWAYDQAISSGVFSKVIVATDDKRICDVVEDYNGIAVLTSSNHTTGTDRILEAVSGMDFDYVVNLQGDEPSLPQDVIQEFVKNLKKIDNQSLLTSVSNATINEVDDSNIVKVVLNNEKYAMYFSRLPIPYSRDGGGGHWYKHTGIYGFTKVGLSNFCSFPKGKLELTEKLEQLRALENGMKILCMVKDYKNFGIDTPKDLELFREEVESSFKKK